MSAKLQPSVHRLRLQAVFPKTQDRDECLQSCSLPSIAYGFKRCSLKHKIGPQEKFCNHYPPCQKVWAAGKRVVKFIGYDAGEGYRSDQVLLGDLADRKYRKW